jgi:hypothetical protein
MKNKIFGFFIVIASIIIVSCHENSSAKPKFSKPDNKSFTISGFVYEKYLNEEGFNYVKDDSFLAVFVSTSFSDPILATVKNTIFTADIPTPESLDALTVESFLKNTSGDIKITPEGVNFALITDFTVALKNSTQQSLRYGSDLLDMASGVFVSEQNYYIYVDNDVSLKGSNETDDGVYVTITNIDINFKKGWNIMRSTLVSNLDVQDSKKSTGTNSKGEPRGLSAINLECKEPSNDAKWSYKYENSNKS